MLKRRCLLALTGWLAMASAMAEAPGAVTGLATEGAPLPMPQACISGFTPAGSGTQNPAATNLQTSKAVAEEEKVPTPVGQWLQHHHWQQGYMLWQRARRCRSLSGAQDRAVCKHAQLLPSEGLCQGPQDGLAFLTMHRHLLHTLRAVWPDYQTPWQNSRALPSRSDFPATQQDRFMPWPTAVLRAAQVVDSLRGMARAQALARWPTEGAFGQWLQCGSTTGGLALDSLYNALLSNPQDGQNPFYLDSDRFWQRLAWIDRAWDAYRKKLGKSPDDPVLQAQLIHQCQVHSAWIEQLPALGSAAVKTPARARVEPQFNHQGPDPSLVGQWLTLVGEVEAVHTDSQGPSLLQIDLRLRATRSVWVISSAGVWGTQIKPGDRLRVAGFLQAASSLDPSGR